MYKRQTRLYDAFSGEIEQMESEYESLLNVDGSGMMGSIEIPKIAVYLPIYHGTSPVSYTHLDVYKRQILTIR